MTGDHRSDMFNSPPIDASSPGQSLWERASNPKLPSPAIVIGLLLLVVFLLRLPSALVPRELNPDESLVLVQAMKFLVDPRPWLAGNTGNAGPPTSYFLSLFLWMGFRPGFVLVHILASIIVCLEILIAYLTLRRIGSEKAAAVGAFLMVLFYGLATHPHYLHYANVLLPNLLVMIGFYIFVVWVDPSGQLRKGTQLCLLFSAGLALGVAPWCKLQTVPVTCVLGLMIITAIFRDGGASSKWRVKELITFCVTFALPTFVMLAVLYKCGGVEEFWHEYVRGAASYAGPLTLIGLFVRFSALFLVWPLRQPLLVALLSIYLLVHAFKNGDIRLLFETKKWACAGLLAYAGATLFAVCRPPYAFATYAIFLVPPMTYLVAAPLQAFPEIADLKKSLRSPRGMIFVGLILLFGALDGARYVNMVKNIHLLRLQSDWNPRIAKPDTRAPHSVETTAKMKHMLACLTITQCSWLVEDSNERIAAVVEDIQRTHQVRSLAIWGDTPGVYVLTGLLPSTRYPIAPVGAKDRNVQKFYWTRFLDDLKKKPPDLFIDAVAPDTDMPDWTEDDGYESDPELQKFIASNYILVDELRLVAGAKAVRFFARREPASTAQCNAISQENSAK